MAEQFIAECDKDWIKAYREYRERQPVVTE
jgi:hypothetical protein